MDYSPKAITQRSSDAYEDRLNWAQLYDELYTYAIPNRRPINTGARTSQQSGSGMDKVFDATATKAAFRFAGRMSRDVTPPFQRIAELKVGPALKAEIAKTYQGSQAEIDEAVAATNVELEIIVDQGHALLERAQFALAADEMYLDLFGGQGAMLMLEDEIEVLKFVAVPVGEIALREDGYGRVCGCYWEKEFFAIDLKGMWPKGEFSEETQKKIQDNPRGKVTVIQAAEFEHASQRWHFFVVEKGKDKLISQTRDMFTSPWLTPRFWKVPGEAMGRGPGLAALPTIKTVNKVTELTLKAVAFAVLGLWTYRNDRVFNPKTARMSPGAMWAVSSNGGPMGPALQRQEMPGRYDVSNIVLQDLREQVKQVTFDDALPPDSGAVRSATEILERMKRLMSDLAGAYPRLLLEIIVPLWQRIIDVLHRRNIIKVRLPLDQLVLKVQITSPIARAQAATDVSSLVEWIQVMISLFGIEGTALVAKVEEIGAEMGQMMGIKQSLIRSPKERQALQQMVAQIIAAATMQKQGAAPAAAPQTEPA
jgi:hypothetical protein